MRQVNKKLKDKALHESAEQIDGLLLEIEELKERLNGKFIYELCDVSSDEQYYSCGVFTDPLELIDCIENENKYFSDWCDENDCETLVIRKRELNKHTSDYEIIYRAYREYCHERERILTTVIKNLVSRG